MFTPKKNFPKKFVEIENNVTTHTERFPLFIKKFGYCSEKKFTVSEDLKFNDILILYSLSSVVQFSHQQDLQYLTANDLVISSCNIPLHFNVVAAVKWDFFYIIINGSHAKFFYNFIRTKHNVLRVNPLSNIVDTFINISETSFDTSVLANFTQCKLLNDLLCELYEISYNIIESQLLIPVQDTDVNNAINYIKTHYKNPISIDTLCNEICLSKFYFCKIFKKHTGISIHQYINEYRINKSKELLSYSKLSVNNISSEVGFNSVLTFIRGFTKSTGITPTEYRKNF